MIQFKQIKTNLDFVNSKLEFTDINAFDETPAPPVNLQHTVIVTNTV